MCLIVFNWQPGTPQWLTLSGNRDEFYQRPTAALSRWDDYPQVLAGRDLEQGGTWMGVTDDGRFAAVTNIRRLNAPQHRRSRGALVGDFLIGNETPLQAAQALAQRADEYGWFNALLGTPEALWYVCNWPEPVAVEVTPGLHVLSNEHLDTPWPKSQLAMQQLQQWQDDSGDERQLAGLLGNRQRFSDDTLPDTGMPLLLEQQLSSQFLNLRDRQYGTRSSSSLVGRLGEDGKPFLRIHETCWDEQGEYRSERVLQARS